MSQELISLSISVHAGPGIRAVLVAQVDRISEVLGWYPRYNDLRAIVMHALNWERRLIERRLSIRPQLPRSSVPSQVSAVAIPTAREMRETKLWDHMILGYEIMKMARIAGRADSIARVTA